MSFESNLCNFLRAFSKLGLRDSTNNNALVLNVVLVIRDDAWLLAPAPPQRNPKQIVSSRRCVGVCQILPLLVRQMVGILPKT